MKPWNVTVDEKSYEVSMKSYSLVINKTDKFKLKNLKSHKEGMFKIYDVPLGSKTAQLYVNSWIGGAKLVMDGVDCATGAPYTAPQLPKWAYIFMVIHCLNLMNGALGWLLAVAGVAATISVSCNSKFSLPVKLLLDVALVVVSALIIFGIAWAFMPLRY